MKDLSSKPVRTFLLGLARVLQMSGLGFDCLLSILDCLAACLKLKNMTHSRSSQDVEVLPTFDASGDSQDMGGVSGVDSWGFNRGGEIIVEKPR